MTNKKELRFFPMSEIRIAMEGEKPILRGHAAVFNLPSVILRAENGEQFREIISPGAFRSALMRCDYRSMFNHNPDKILGRRSAGTMIASEDASGVPYEVNLPDTTYARDLQVSMSRGDVKECSFGFSVREGGDSWQKDNTGMWVRTIMEDGIEEIYDLSPVVFPAYPDTSCALRSLEKVRAETMPFNDTELQRLKLQIATI